MLDDIFDKLDNQRVQKLMELVSQQHFGQVLVTDTDPTRIRSVFQDNGFECKNFLVNNGEIHVSDDLQFANVKLAQSVKNDTPELM